MRWMLLIIPAINRLSHVSNQETTQRNEWDVVTLVQMGISLRTEVDVYVNKGPLVDMVGKITKCLGQST